MPVAAYGSLEVFARVYLLISINGQDAGQINVRLFAHTPKTSNNFLQLAKAGRYDGTSFTRIIPDYMAQGGDITNKNGLGAESYYGGKFKDENFDLEHKGRGVLSMANFGRDTNGSQFYLSFVKTNWLDGKNVVFGAVEDGWDVLKKIEAAGTSRGRPTAKVIIKKAGQL